MNSVTGFFQRKNLSAYLSLAKGVARKVKSFRIMLIVLSIAFGLVLGAVCVGLLKESIASIFVLALTGGALIAYAWDTHRIAEMTKTQLMESQKPKVGIQLVAGPTASDIILNTIVKNMSNAFCQVWTKFDIRVYGKRISHSARYDGEEPWNLLPNAEIQGWFSIFAILRKAGKDPTVVLPDNMVKEHEKLSITVTLRAKGTPGGEVEYPQLHWYVKLTPAKIDCVYMS